MRIRLSCSVVILALGAAACSREPAPPPSTTVDQGQPPYPTPHYDVADDEFSVMTYNLWRYSMEDRDDDGQRDDPLPREQRDALIKVIASVQPDVLAVQEMGGPTMFEQFRAELEAVGLTYTFQEYLQRDKDAYRQVNLAVLSRLPIVSHQSHLDDQYSIAKRNDMVVSRGFIDIDIGVSPAYQFRLMVAHLKSKLYHEYGQTEMRRNEARLLNKHVRASLKENPDRNLLVLGDLNDTYRSRAIREVIGYKKSYLHDLRPVDFLGDAWTHWRKYTDEYARIDYAMVSNGMLPELVESKTRAVRHPLMTTASDHRPLVAVFQASDQEAKPLPETEPEN